MLKLALFKRFFVLLFILGILDICAEVFYLHWTIWWFDVLLHSLAGFLIGIAVSLLWYKDFTGYYEQKIKIIWIVLASALILGLWWEFMEIYFEATSLSDGIIYLRDTTSDLIADVFGSFFGAMYSFPYLAKNRKL